VYVADSGNDRIQVFGWAYASTWRGEYFDNPHLAGTPALIGQDANLAFDWGDGAPTPEIPTDSFSVRWQRYIWLEEGTYHLAFRVDDGVRCWVDDALILDEWHPQSTEFSRTFSVARGYHRLRIEYYDLDGGAHFFLSELCSLVALPLVQRSYTAPLPLLELRP
jgi:hypothetical protein